jgi:hypothetical protein
MKVARFGYEKAGPTVYDEPIPWNADAVLVEFLVEFPGHAAGPRSDFRWGLPGDVNLTAVTLHPGDQEDTCRIQFRLGRLRRTVRVDLSWRGRPLGRVVVPHLSAGEFLRNLRLEVPGTFAELGDYDPACRALVAGQGRRLTACGLLKSPTSLLPVVGWGLVLEWSCAASGETRRIPTHLTGAQATARQALLHATVRPWPCAEGVWSWRWVVAQRPLARGEFRVVSRQAFQESLHLAGDPHRGGEPVGEVGAGPGAAGRDATDPLALHVRIGSREPGLAALCPVEVHVRYKDRARPPEVLEKEVLVTDVPSLSAPATVAVRDFHLAHVFDVFGNGQFLGTVSRQPAPAATFTSEGGFRGPEDFDWTVFAEEELEEHLGRLMEAPAA